MGVQRFTLDDSIGEFVYTGPMAFPEAPKTIYSVNERKTDGADVTHEDLLRPGTDLVVAGYCMYGSAIDFVVTFKAGVQRFTLDDSIGEFVYTGPMAFPEAPKTIYSVNEGNSVLWD